MLISFEWTVYLGMGCSAAWVLGEAAGLTPPLPDPSTGLVAGVLALLVHVFGA